MELSVPERLVLINMLPKEGDFATLKTVRQTREALAFDDDAEAFGIRQEEGRITWQKDGLKEIDLSPRAISLIADALRELDQQKRLSEDHCTLYEKFVEG